MRKKNPKPRKYDTVERIDMTEVCGGIEKIIDNKRVLVNWGDKKTTEFIKDLAIVERK